MPNRTSIEWTDFSSNPIAFRDREPDRKVHACVRVSAGCKNCYAATIARRFERRDFDVRDMAKVEPFVDGDEVCRILRSRKIAGKRVFVGDMTDVFGEWVSDEMLDVLFAAMALRPDVTFQVLTKRPERMRAYVSAMLRDPSGVVAAAHAITGRQLGAQWSPPAWLSDAIQSSTPKPLRTLDNVHLGVSVEDQAAADERIPLLLDTPATLRFLSVEPLLGEVDLRGYLPPAAPAVDWVIVGGES